MTTYAERLTQRARELYQPIHVCQCGHLVNLAAALKGSCPACHRLSLAGPITPDRARQMLAELEGERIRLGLEVAG